MFIQLCRCVDSAPVLAIICVTVLLAKGCVCVTEDEDDEVLEKKQLVEFYSKLPAGPLVKFNCLHDGKHNACSSSLFPYFMKMLFNIRELCMEGVI